MSRRDRARGRSLPTGAEVKALVLEAHNALHADPVDVDGCHDALHRAMGTGETDIDPGRFDPDSTAAMDADFRAFCRRHGVAAMYVVHLPDGRLISGGEAGLCAEMDRVNRAGVAALRLQEARRRAGP